MLCFSLLSPQTYVLLGLLIQRVGLLKQGYPAFSSCCLNTELSESKLSLLSKAKNCTLVQHRMVASSPFSDLHSHLHGTRGLWFHFQGLVIFHSSGIIWQLKNKWHTNLTACSPSSLCIPPLIRFLSLFLFSPRFTIRKRKRIHWFYSGETAVLFRSWYILFWRQWDK